jgi:hypothetical protein
MNKCEISISCGRSQITLKGADAIREAGWTLRFLLFALGVSFLLFGGRYAFALCAVQVWWWLSL